MGTHKKEITVPILSERLALTILLSRATAFRCGKMMKEKTWPNVTTVAPPSRKSPA